MPVPPQKKFSDFVCSDPARLGGEPVFRGTRVPVRSLFDHLRDGVPLDEFLEDFPGVTREQAQTVIEFAQTEVLSAGRAP